MSALSTPSCSGKAAGTLSTFTISAGRARVAASRSGTPVSGAIGGAVVLVVVVTFRVVVVVASSFFFPPPHPTSDAATSATEAASRNRLRMTSLELTERGDALLEGRVGVEEVVEPRRVAAAARVRVGLRERGLDPEVRGRTRRGVHHRRVALELLERADQPGRVARQRDAADVGEGLAATAHRALHDAPDDRSEDQQEEPQEGDDRAGAAAVAVVVAMTRTAPPHEPQREVSEQRDDADEGDGERRDEDVVVLDVAELVREHALELDAVHLGE